MMNGRQTGTTAVVHRLGLSFIVHRSSFFLRRTVMAELSTVPQKDRTDLSHPETTRGGYHFVPRVDIFETENELLLLADLAGVRPEDVDLHYEKGELMLFARVRERQPRENLLLQEY